MELEEHGVSEYIRSQHVVCPCEC